MPLKLLILITKEDHWEVLDILLLSHFMKQKISFLAFFIIIATVAFAQPQGKEDLQKKEAELKREILELNGDSSHFNSYSDTTLKYILYSNVFNYPDSLIDKIANTPAIYYQEKGSVYIGIYTIAK